MKTFTFKLFFLFLSLLVIVSCEKGYYYDPAPNITFDISFSPSIYSPVSPDSVLNVHCVCHAHDGAFIGRVVFYAEIDKHYIAFHKNAFSTDFTMDISFVPSDYLSSFINGTTQMSVVFTAMDQTSDFNFHSTSYTITLKP